MTRKKSKVTRLPIRRRFLIGCKQLGEHGGIFHGSLFLEFSPQQWAALIYEKERVKYVIDERTSVIIEGPPHASIDWLPWPFPSDKPWIELHRDAESPAGPDIRINWTLTLDYDGASWSGNVEGSPVAYASGVLPLDLIEP